MLDDETELLRRIDAAQERIRVCNGAKLYSELSAVARTYRLFGTNERELLSYFARYDDTQAQ